MACANTKLKITSINTQGLKSNADYVAHLLDLNDIIFVCEHWLSNAEKILIDNLSDVHKPYFSPAKQGPSGRPFGGNCFLVSKKIRNIKILHEDPNILAIQQH